MALSDIYNRVTSKIIEDLEKGVRPWMKPWSGNNAAGRIMQPLRSTGLPYKGINVLLLWDAATEKGFTSPYWMTFKQAKALKASVKKGEHGSLVVYADSFKVADQDKGEDATKDVYFLKGYTVFNVEQIDGLDEKYTVNKDRQDEPMALVEQAEMFFKGTGATFNHGGNRAFYVPSRDLIQLPKPEAFRDPESYAATKAHELVHWTGHEKRLSREFGKRFGDDAYAFEELIAETGSAMCCAALAITNEVQEGHSAYIDHWLKVLKADNKAIFHAASHAQKAVDHLFEIQPQPFYP